MMEKETREKKFLLDKQFMFERAFTNRYWYCIVFFGIMTLIFFFTLVVADWPPLKQLIVAASFLSPIAVFGMGFFDRWRTHYRKLSYITGWTTAFSYASMVGILLFYNWYTLSFFYFVMITNIILYSEYMYRKWMYDNNIIVGPKSYHGGQGGDDPSSSDGPDISGE